MITYLNKRKRREFDALPPAHGDVQKVSDDQLFGQLGNKIRRVKR